MIAFAKHILKKILRIERRRSKRRFLLDEEIFWESTHEPKLDKKTHDEAWIVIQYHIIEKGLTMPDRHLAFGMKVISNLMAAIGEYVQEWQELPDQVVHAIGVVKAYHALHEAAGYVFPEDRFFWDSVCAFVERYPDVPVAFQGHVTYDQFYSKRESSFPVFAQSRHALRNYSDEVVPKSKIVESVRLAMTSPSACNRQHVRVHCIANRDLSRRILEVQGGNRGFGHMADKGQRRPLPVHLSRRRVDAGCLRSGMGRRREIVRSEPLVLQQ